MYAQLNSICPGSLGNYLNYYLRIIKDLFCSLVLSLVLWCWHYKYYFRHYVFYWAYEIMPLIKNNIYTWKNVAAICYFVMWLWGWLWVGGREGSWKRQNSSSFIVLGCVYNWPVFIKCIFTVRVMWRSTCALITLCPLYHLHSPRFNILILIWV